MMILDNLVLFLRIVEKGGLAAAGRELGLSAASVSERLVALEKYYGAALLHRTTRAINLTDEGRLLVQGARRLLAEADELESLIRLGVEKISGPIRLSAPIDLGRSYVVPTLDAFLAEHPEVTIDLNLTDGYVDLVGQGQDFAIRYGELADSTLRVKRLAENRRFVCASPAYLKTRGTPQYPDDLVHHECLVMRYGLTTDRDWPFLIDGKERRVVVQGHRIANDGELVRVWLPERTRYCPKITPGCRGGFAGGCPRRTSAGILGWQYGTADRLSRHTGAAAACASLDREDRRGFFLVRPLI
jgi:DNA-binding transcriptional LysR family regulator